MGSHEPMSLQAPFVDGLEISDAPCTR